MESYINYFNKVLEARYPAREARQLFRILCEDLLAISMPVSRDFQPNKSQSVVLAKAISDLQAGKPIQYITGMAHFYGYVFKVNEAVLIPRPETEELVQRALHLLDTIDVEAPQVLDVGTGSGCIPIVVKKKRPKAVVSALDKSTDALDIASKNAMELDVEVNFLNLDFTDESAWVALEQYDMLLSNPPYIPWSERHLVGDNVLGQEPDMALFVENEDPLLFYRLLVRFAQSHLRAKGHILVETNQYNATEVATLFSKAGLLGVEIIEDLMGNDRMVRAIKANQ